MRNKSLWTEKKSISNYTMLQVKRNTCKLNHFEQREAKCDSTCSSLHDYHAQKSEGFLLTYSITSRNSFQRIRDLHHTILRNKAGETDIPIVLLANKCDLSGEREVPTIEGEILAQKMGWDFFETSAKDKTNVDMAFERLVSRVRRDQKVCLDRPSIAARRLMVWDSGTLQAHVHHPQHHCQQAITRRTRSKTWEPQAANFAS